MDDQPPDHKGALFAALVIVILAFLAVSAWYLLGKNATTVPAAIGPLGAEKQTENERPTTNTATK